MILDTIAAKLAKAARRRADRARDAGRWTEAAAHYRRWLAHRPGDAAIWKQLGHMLKEDGDLAGADAAYRAADGFAPGDADLWLYRGHLARLRDDRDAAIAYYRASHGLDGNETARHELDAIGGSDEQPREEAAEEAELEPVEDAAPRVGAIEYLDDEVAHGWLDPLADDDAIAFLDGDRRIGRAWADRSARRGDGFEFRTLLPVDRPTRVRAVRMSDARELDGSPFEASPHRARPSPERPAWDARIEVAVRSVLPAQGEIALLITHSRTGAVKPHVLPYVRALAERGIATLLIAVTDRPLNVAAELREAAAGVLIRENAGYDFAAWAHAIRLYPEVYGASILYLLNDSVVPTFRGDRFDRMLGRVRTSSADLVGLTESHEYRWHLQTYFLALKPGALSRFQVHRFFESVAILGDKDAVIRRYELPMAEELERGGCTIDVLFPSPAALNPVLRTWRDMLRRDLPFVKLLLLRGAFPEIDTGGWREALAAADFDMALVDATLHASEETVPRDRDDRLSAHPAPRLPVELASLKIAFYGPWNYDNGLGVASRGLIGALRRVGVRLNLHPVERPFHVHRPLAPAVDIREFDGAADIAIVHLNPDSWHLLTDAQRADIRAARKRIGYWVWEMAHIPDAWWPNFAAVDRIWAPSTYCARLFAAQDGAPVDVVPHAVPVPAGQAGDRAAALRAIGVDPARRVALYVFDGSSYLVRKNPAALVRAFAAAGLAARGWTLVLKTKHLHDLPGEGEALATLVAGEEGVTLVDRAQPAGDLAALMAAADLYASPHASEGFGLTIAEAMALGKPVVATDFGGSADILDVTTGYPVRAHPWRLARDFGHYTQGGEWARIDEPALADALRRAADAIEAGDERLGTAARQRVRAALSFEAVGRAIATSIEQVVRDLPVSVPARVERLNLRAGVALDHGSGDERVRVVPLRADGSVPDDLDLHKDDRAKWIAFAPEGAVLSPLFAATVIAHAAGRLDVDIFYGDDIAGDVDEAIDQLRLKPAFDPVLLAAQDYVGAPVIVAAAALRALGGLDPSMGTAALADLLFRAHAAGRSIVRIPEVLLAHPGARVRPTNEEYRAMLAAQPSLAAYAIVPGRAPGCFALRRRYPADDEPPVTVIVPTRRTHPPGGTRAYVETVLAGLAATDWPMDRLTVIVGDDIVGDPGWAKAEWPFTLRRIETPRPDGAPFNYAAKMNRLWREAATEQIVFLNDDVRLVDPGWLRALQTFALDRDVGGVGIRMLFVDGTLQHAGLAPHGLGAAHMWVYRRRERGSYQDWALVHRQWSMVTGAVFATRRSLMEEINGFDEAFTVEFNDTDLCLRLRALGYRIVCTADAELVHTEKASRGQALPGGATIARFLAKWSGWLADDPAWHPRLRTDRFDVTPDVRRREWYF